MAFAFSKSFCILVPKAGAFYVMDCGYLDFARLYSPCLGAAFFVIRGKSNLQCRRLFSHPVDKDTGLRSGYPGHRFHRVDVVNPLTARPDTHTVWRCAGVV